MGIGIFGVMHIGKEALYTQQSALGVASHNLANVNTQGYSRQSPVIEAFEPQNIGGILFGRGSRVSDITKSYDQFLNKNIVFEKSLLGRWEIKESLVTQVESIFNESDEVGLNALMNEFWRAWEDLSNHPEGIPERTILQSHGDVLAAKFKNMTTRLKDIQDNANQRIQNVATKINEITSEIAALNNKIVGMEMGRSNANDLTDQRAVMIEELTQLIDVNVLEGLDGQVTILTSGGNVLVTENITFPMSVANDPEKNNFYAVRIENDGYIADITDKINGGELKGLLEIRDEIVPSYIQQLNVLAATMISEVNKIHYQGYGLDGSTGNYFFNPGTTLLEANIGNKGDARIYNAQIEDPTQMLASDFEVRFTSQDPMTTRYAAFDTLNNEYIYHIDSGNNSIIFNDTAGGGGADSTVQLTRGTYTGSELAAEIQAQLEDKSATSQQYSVTFDKSRRYFSITNNGTETITIKWDDANTNAARILGFEDTAGAAITSNSVSTSSFSSGTYVYSERLYDIRTGINDVIRFDDGDGPVSAVLSQGIYNAEELAREVERAMEAAGVDSAYTVSYDRVAQRYSISYDTSGGGNLSLLWGDAATTAETIMGFDAVSTVGITAGAADTGDSDATGTYRYMERVFSVISGTSQIVFDDGGNGGYVTADLEEGNYTGEELAEEIEKKLESVAGSSGQEYIVTFDSQLGKFSIINASGNLHAIDFDWTASSAAGLMGFDALPTAPVAVGGSQQSNNEVGQFVEYKKIDLYGISAQISDGTDSPSRGDVFSIYRVKDAALGISMDSVTGSDPDKISAAQGIANMIAFDVDGSNNTIVFDDDGDLTDGVSYSVTIPGGRYTEQALASEIEKQLEENGSGQSYQVVYDSETQQFVFNSNPSNANDLVLFWEHPDSSASYMLGFSEDLYQITEGLNDQIVFNEGGTPLTATLRSGSYDGEGIAAEIQTQLERSGAGQYVVTYDSTLRAFTINNESINTTTLSISWDSSSAASSLGFASVSSPPIGPGASDTSDFVINIITTGSSMTSDFATSGAEVGDNRNAIAMADLKNAMVIEGKSLSMSGYYSVVIGDVGTTVDESERNVSFQKFMLEQFEQRRQSISGVSLDDEMVNLIKFQQSYAAATKLITTLDSMLDSILGIR